MERNSEVPNREEMRQIIRDLNWMDLDRAGFDEITERIQRLITGFATPVVAVSVPSELCLYRARKNPREGKPEKVDQLGAPRPEFVTSYQRCNNPGSPMFYCSRLPITALIELDVHQGDIIYISQWSVEQPFIFNAGFTDPDRLKSIGPNQDTIATFFETKFCQPIHETYSNQYKITAAITQVLTSGNINGLEEQSLHFLAAAPDGIGGIAYPSVAVIGRSSNLAIKPCIVDRCLALNFVEEWLITEVAGQSISFERKDFTADFSNGLIHWTGEKIHWKLKGPQVVTATAELDGWVVRDENNQIIKPG